MVYLTSVVEAQLEDSKSKEIRIKSLENEVAELQIGNHIQMKVKSPGDEHVDEVRFKNNHANAHTHEGARILEQHKMDSSVEKEEEPQTQEIPPHIIRKSKFKLFHRETLSLNFVFNCGRIPFY